MRWPGPESSETENRSFTRNASSSEPPDCVRRTERKSSFPGVSAGSVIRWVGAVVEATCGSWLCATAGTARGAVATAAERPATAAAEAIRVAMLMPTGSA